MTIGRQSSNAGVPTLRLVIVAMDTNLAGAAERAYAALRVDYPGLELAFHGSSEWAERPDRLERCRRDIAAADIVIASMLFMEDHFRPVLDALEARRDACDAMICLLSAGEVMRLTRMGNFRMDQEQGGIAGLLKRLRGAKRDRSATAGAQQMKMLKRLPQILRFIPGTAQDVRVYFLALQYFLAGSDENIANLVRSAIDRFADGPRRVLRGRAKPKPPIEYPDVGVYHPAMPGRIGTDLR